MKMGDGEKQLREMIARLNGTPVGNEAILEEYKHSLRDFLDNGPGTREQRRQILLHEFKKEGGDTAFLKGLRSKRK